MRMSKPFIEQATGSWGCPAAFRLQALGLLGDTFKGLSFHENRPMHLSPLAGNFRPCWGNLKEPGVFRSLPRAAAERRSGV